VSDAHDRSRPASRPPSGHRYGRVAILFHWLIAAAILLQIGLGWGMAKLKGLPSFDAFQLHKSIGIAILLLSLARLGWRLAHRPPAPIDQAAWLQRAASLVHLGFYAIMIGLPLSGWIMVSTAKIDIPTLLFHTLPWPHLPGLHGLSAGAKQPWFGGARLSHSVLVYATLALLALHIGGVIKHQWLDRDAVLDKMAPGSRPGWREPRLWGAFALLLAVFVVGGRLYQGAAPAAPMAPRDSKPAEPVADAPEAPAAAVAETNPAAPAPAAARAADRPDGPAATPVAWTIAAARSKLGFTASWSGQPIDGHFDRWTGDILFSPDALDRSKIRIEVDLASAATGDSQRDASLPTADWFDVPDHPKAVWTSARITRTGGNRYRAAGTLELRGISKPLALGFTLEIHGRQAEVEGHTTIDRVRHGVGQGQWAATDQIAAAVALHFTVHASRE
jgi:cytochrome b561/polyisoprenoid-binding protein YceI